MSDSSNTTHAPVALVAIAGWILPGSGYWLLGQKQRAMATGITVIAIFLLGLLLGSVRVIEVPGFNDLGQTIETTIPGTRQSTSIMVASPLTEIKAKPWSIAQILAGPLGILSGMASIWASPNVPMSHTPVNEAGTLYTAVAGMLNLLVIIDSSHRATVKEPA